MWEPYYRDPAESQPPPYGIRTRRASEDTRVQTRGGGTATLSQAVHLRSGRLNRQGVQLADLVESKSSGELVTYVRSGDSAPLRAPARLRLRLARAGLLARIEPALVAKYTSERRERISPLPMEGKPLSQIVIEERER